MRLPIALMHLKDILEKPLVMYSKQSLLIMEVNFPTGKVWKDPVLKMKREPISTMLILIAVQKEEVTKIVTAFYVEQALKRVQTLAL